KGIYTPASAILSEKGAPGTAGVTGGRGARVKRERSPWGPRGLRPRCPTSRCLDPSRLVAAPKEEKPPDPEASSGGNYGLGGARLRQGEPAPRGLAEAGVIFLELDLAGECRMQRRLRRLPGWTGPVTLGRHGGDQLGAGHRLLAL